MFCSCDERDEEQQRAATREEEEEEANHALLPPPRRTVAAPPAAAAALADIVALICGVEVCRVLSFFFGKEENSPHKKNLSLCNLHKNLQSSLLCRAARERYLHTFLSLSLNLHRAARVLRKTRVFIKVFI